MAFVKANLTVVICAVVVLLMGGIMVWPTLGWDEGVQDDMKTRLKVGEQAKGLIQPTIEVYPGAPAEAVLKNATAEDNVKEARVQAQNNMKRQAEEIGKKVAAENKKNRVNDAGVPLLSGRPEPGFLPVKQVTADAFEFKNHYESQFPAWVQKVVGGMPPSQAEADQQVKLATDEKERQAQAENSVMHGAGGAGTAQLSTMAKREILKRAVTVRAARIRCYVDDNTGNGSSGQGTVMMAGLQRRSWFGKSTPPDSNQIFEAFIDSWFQQDVITAIATVNGEVLDSTDPKKKLAEKDKNVGRSPIKRLESITVGNGALSGPGQSGGGGGIFFGMGLAAGSGTAAAAGPGGLDFSRSMTGHVGTSEYDVVLMKIVVDLDPRYQNRFIDELYRQNNGYTVLNINTKIVDPLEAASNGFLYGPTQVVHVEILMEGLLFKSWTAALMPPDFTKATTGTGTLSPSGPTNPWGNNDGGSSPTFPEPGRGGGRPIMR